MKNKAFPAGTPPMSPSPQPGHVRDRDGNIVGEPVIPHLVLVKGGKDTIDQILVDICLVIALLAHRRTVLSLFGRAKSLAEIAVRKMESRWAIHALTRALQLCDRGLTSRFAPDLAGGKGRADPVFDDRRGKLLGHVALYPRRCCDLVRQVIPLAGLRAINFDPVARVNAPVDLGGADGLRQACNALLDLVGTLVHRLAEAGARDPDVVGFMSAIGRALSSGIEDVARLIRAISGDNVCMIAGNPMRPGAVVA